MYIKQDYKQFLAQANHYGFYIIDPPWQYKDKPKRVRRAINYNLLDENYSCIKYIFDTIKTDHIFLWCTNSMLPIVFDAIKDTNYEYKTCVTWLKTTKYGKYAYGLGNSFRQCTEQLLIFDRRGVKPIRSSLRSIVVALRCPRTRKPKNFETSLANFMVNSGLSGCYLFSGAPMDEDLLSIIDYVDIV